VENTEAYIDTVPFAERWLVLVVLWWIFPYKEYTQMARVCLASGLEQSGNPSLKYCAKWIFIGLYAVDVVTVFWIERG
jgi:hypothetical protein